MFATTHTPTLPPLARSLASPPPPLPLSTREDASAQPPPAKKKTNSERGKEFRAKRKLFEQTLVGSVEALRREVDDLRYLRAVRLERGSSGVLHDRASQSGPLARLAQEYFALFERGMAGAHSSGAKRALCDAQCGSSASTNASGSIDAELLAQQRQLRFLECAMEPDLRFGELRGVAHLADQWRRYTAYHAGMRVELVRIDVSGPAESPVVTVHSRLHVRYSRRTFEHLFPHAAGDEALVRRFLGKQLTYPSLNHFRFSDRGQIASYDSDVGFVEALLEAGASVADIEMLMNRARISDHAVIGNVDDESSGHPVVRPDEHPVVCPDEHPGVRMDEYPGVRPNDYTSDTAGARDEVRVVDHIGGDYHASDHCTTSCQQGASDHSDEYDAAHDAPWHSTDACIINSETTPASRLPPLRFSPPPPPSPPLCVFEELPEFDGSSVGNDGGIVDGIGGTEDASGTHEQREAATEDEEDTDSDQSRDPERDDNEIADGSIGNAKDDRCSIDADRENHHESGCSSRYCHFSTDSSGGYTSRPVHYNNNDINNINNIDINNNNDNNNSSSDNNNNNSRCAQWDPSATKRHLAPEQREPERIARHPDRLDIRFLLD